MRKFKILTLLVLIISILSFSTGCSCKTLVPEKTEGRFDFSVTYEMNGEEITYNGVYVCKFDGVYFSFYGNGRDWIGYVENTEKEDVIVIQTNEDGIIYISFNFYPEYFMGDPDYDETFAPNLTLYIVYHDEDPDVAFSDNDSTIDFMEKYGIRIIDFSYADPIENNYKRKLRFGRLDISIN
jgi:hypothetical protein